METSDWIAVATGGSGFLISVFALVTSIRSFRRSGVAEVTARISEGPTIETLMSGTMNVLVKNLGPQTAYKVRVEVEEESEFAAAHDRRPHHVTKIAQGMIGGQSLYRTVSGFVDEDHLAHATVHWKDSQGRHRATLGGPPQQGQVAQL